MKIIMISLLAIFLSSCHGDSHNSSGGGSGCIYFENHNCTPGRDRENPTCRGKWYC